MMTCVRRSLVVLLVVLTASVAYPQSPGVYLYFDGQFAESCRLCPVEPLGTVVDTLYVVAKDFGASISSLEFSISYPPQVTWLGESWVSGACIGSTPIGVAHQWASPLNAAADVLIGTIVFVWMCDGCIIQNLNALICVEPHPGAGLLRATRSSDQQTIYPKGYGVVICPMLPECGPWLCTSGPSPVEETGWGRIKAMFRDR
jgi:hypothetical protein